MGKLIPMSRTRSVATLAELPEAAPSVGGYGADAGSSLELLPVAGLLFVASLARVLFAFWKHEHFGTEATLASVCVLALPWLASRGLVERYRNRDVTR
jgi:hypothetical protein